MTPAEWAEAEFDSKMELMKKDGRPVGSFYGLLGVYPRPMLSIEFQPATDDGGGLDLSTRWGV